jgi:hypothetical protein
MAEKFHLQNSCLSLQYWWGFQSSTIWCHVDWWTAYRPACWLHPPGIYTVSYPRRLEYSKLTKDPLVPAHTPIQGPLPTTPTTDPSRRLNTVQPTAPPKEHEPSAPTLDSNTKGPCHSTNHSTQDHMCSTQTLAPQLKVTGAHTTNTPQNELLKIPHIRVSLPQDT